MICFNGKYYDYHCGEKEEQGLAIGGYESAFLVDLVASYVFEKAKAHSYQTMYHVIYRDDGLVVFKGKKSVKEIKDWFYKFKKNWIRRRETNTSNSPRKFGNPMRTPPLKRKRTGFRL